MFASRFSTPRVHIIKSFQRPGGRKRLPSMWKSQMKTSKQRNNIATSPTPAVMLGKPPDTRKAVVLSRAGNSLEVLWCSPQTMLFPGISPYRLPLLWEDPQFLLGLKTSHIAWSYSTVRKEEKCLGMIWFGKCHNRSERWGNGRQ